MTTKEDIEILLPWYATGKLDKQDKQIVDNYLAEHPDVAQQLELIQEEGHAVIDANEALGAPRPNLIDNVMAQIDAEERHRPQSIMDRISKLLPAMDVKSMQLAGLAAVALILAQAVVIATLIASAPNSPTFETATGTEPTQILAPDMIVGFAPNATAETIASLLEELDISIVSGPKAGGLYEARFTDPRPTPEEIQSIFSKLKDNKAIESVTLSSP